MQPKGKVGKIFGHGKKIAPLSFDTAGQLIVRRKADGYVPLGDRGDHHSENDGFDQEPIDSEEDDVIQLRGTSVL
jgi:hypothetical protein